MKLKRMAVCLIAALLYLMMVCACPVRAGQDQPGDDIADWTVMFYLCGSDLESHYGYASGNLKEISGCTRPTNYLAAMTQPLGMLAGLTEKRDSVQVLIETGGSASWHAQETLGLDVRADKLQRWRFSCGDMTKDSAFTLEQELPLSSMGDPDTLADFIRWAAKTSPARRYALVLWDHGEGARTGLFIDENFRGDMMYINELSEALEKGGVDFEITIIDACMMANIETAWALHGHSRWMCASEEVLPGRGTAVGAWLQELYNNPDCDGRRLGRCVCDLTQQKYANMNDEQANDILTFSVVNLDKIEPLAAAFDQYFETAGIAYEQYPSFLQWYTMFIGFGEEYGSGEDDMIDFGSIFYHPTTISMMDVGYRARALDALTDVVDYCVKGPGRSASRGLSFFYAARFDEETLDIYARNCPSPHYLALLDAISPWTAPDWVYEQVKPLTEVSGRSEYGVTVEKMFYNGLPAFMVEGVRGSVYYRMYRLNEQNGRIQRLGRSVCTYHLAEDGQSAIWHANEPWMWPAIEGEYCDIEIVSMTDQTYVYNIPVRLGTQKWFLRCSREFDAALLEQLKAYSEVRDAGRYRIYGLWEGYESDSLTPTRNVVSLSTKAGAEFELLYPILADGTAPDAGYDVSASLTLYRAMDISEIPIQPGTYYIEYELEDVFGRSMVLDRVEVIWDGSRFSCADPASWEGSVGISYTRQTK